jgi:poly(3-hydroxybutyrate) depolymerase
MLAMRTRRDSKPAHASVEHGARVFRSIFVLFPLLSITSCGAEDAAGVGESIDPGRFKYAIESSVDGHQQPCYVIVPEGLRTDGEPVPLLVSLHSWSNDCEYRSWKLERLAEEKGWIYLYPNFRGPNKTPSACGSSLAQQDILDAVDWAKERYPVDERRIYLLGVSGGGHMTLQMVGNHPEVWAAASAWCGPTDLVAWHNVRKNDKYGAMMRASCGGAPGDSEAVDRQYHQRSPVSHLHNAAGVPVEICHGVHDGYAGSVPIVHSLNAFNIIAKAAGSNLINDEEIAQLTRPDGHLDDPRPSDQVADELLGKEIHLRRHAGSARITIFEGGHEGNAAAAVSWLEKHVKK